MPIMKILNSALLSASVLALPIENFQYLADEDQLLFLVHEAPVLDIQHYNVGGLLDGRYLDIAISINRDVNVNYMNIIATIDGSSYVATVFALDGIENVDLSTAYVTGRLESVRYIEVGFRFGHQQDCFINDDGRDTIKIMVHDGGNIEASVVRIVNCSPVETPFVLRH